MHGEDNYQYRALANWKDAPCIGLTSLTGLLFVVPIGPPFSSVPAAPGQPKPGIGFFIAMPSPYTLQPGWFLCRSHVGYITRLRDSLAVSK